MSRAVGNSSSVPAPQAGLATAVDGLTMATPTSEWIVPPPGTSGNPAVSGAAPRTLALVNMSSSPETFTASAVTSGREHVLATGTLEPGATETVSGSTLSDAAFDPIVVRGGGPMAVSEDLVPSGTVGAVSMPGIPLAGAIGL